MRDAVGGVVNLVIIVVFMVIVSGYLAFNVNYTKAFRVKNKIISTIEEYEGNVTNRSVEEQITKYMRDIGYNTGQNMNCSGRGMKDGPGGGWCYLQVRTNYSGGVNEDNIKVYYKVVTQIQIDMPIIRNVMPYLRFFTISGDTKAIKISEDYLE
ncbi:MAG: hypothetical protein IJ193_06305 [Bacilli bacterium]|nr:hypothetical protein [Bacilli bacterium]